MTEAKGDAPGDFNTTEDEVKPTESEYDVLNRTLKVTLPDGAVTETAYGFGSDRDGNNQFSTPALRNEVKAGRPPMQTENRPSSSPMCGEE